MEQSRGSRGQRESDIQIESERNDAGKAGGGPNVIGVPPTVL